MARTFDAQKLAEFKGSVLKNLKAPDNYRSYIATCRKVVKLHLRCHRDEVFFPKLIESLKKAAKVLKYLGATRYRAKTPLNLLELLEEISEINVERWLEFKKYIQATDADQIILEESRERIQGTRCSMCRVHLEYPAYVVRRSETQVLHRSLPIGVKCLHSQQNKLQKFLDAPQVIEALNAMELLQVG